MQLFKINVCFKKTTQHRIVPQRISNKHILKCGAQAAEQAALAVSPVFYDILPLTLEEIFIYELGGADYAVKELVL